MKKGAAKAASGQMATAVLSLVAVMLVVSRGALNGGECVLRSTEYV